MVRAAARGTVLISARRRNRDFLRARDPDGGTGGTWSAQSLPWLEPGAAPGVRGNQLTPFPLSGCAASGQPAISVGYTHEAYVPVVTGSIARSLVQQGRPIPGALPAGARDRHRGRSPATGSRGRRARRSGSDVSNLRNAEDAGTNTQRRRMAAVLTQGATEHPGPLHQQGDDADGDDAERDQQSCDCGDRRIHLQDQFVEHALGDGVVGARQE